MNAEPRSPAALEAAEAAIVTAAAVMVGTAGPAALAYSGGAESGLLLHLLHPLRDVLPVVWVNPGALPHEAEHIRRQTEGWRLVEIATDREAAWREHGLPTLVLPQANEPSPFFRGDGPMPAVPLTASKACCMRVRTQPGNQWAADNKIAVMIHGQRRGEGTALFSPGILPAQWGPLAHWSRADVMARVQHHGIPLPAQYAEGYPKSFECAVCPADMTRERLAFLARHYPEQRAETMRHAAVIAGAIKEAVDDLAADYAEALR